MRDLVLESRAGDWGVECVKAILPNVQGQKYALGSFYPGERGGEEFIFTRNRNGNIGPTDGAIISVDDQGQYWIQNDTRNVERTTRSSVYNTFVNEERLKAVEIRLLKSGDRISIGDLTGTGLLPYFCVKERTIGGSHLRTDSDSDIDSPAGPSVPTSADSPLVNNLILEEIMSYLPLEDLKSARLVCKKWKEEASKALEKRGSVSFTFDDDYMNPENSTKVFRYLHEMRDLKMRNLHIIILRDWCSTLFFSDGELGQKMMDDLRKLLTSSHNFSTLHLRVDIEEKSGFLPFATIFQELGQKLVELKLDINQLLIPAVVPPFPLMRNLKKLTAENSEGEFEPSWAPLLVPLFSNNLEHFTCWNRPETHLDEFVKHPMPNLKGIELKETANGLIISRLLEFRNPLTSLEIQYCKACSEPEELLERLLLKHSPSLKTLVIRIGYCFVGREIVEVKFPSFPKLQELELEYGRTVSISWGAGLDYGKHFPSLRRLTVRARGRWTNDDQVFNAFFPVKRNLRCRTVEEVWIPVLPHDSFRQTMNQIKRIFPKAEKWSFSSKRLELGLGSGAE